MRYTGRSDHSHGSVTGRCMTMMALPLGCLWRCGCCHCWKMLGFALQQDQDILIYTHHWSSLIIAHLCVIGIMAGEKNYLWCLGMTKLQQDLFEKRPPTSSFQRIPKDMMRHSPQTWHGQFGLKNRTTTWHLGLDKLIFCLAILRELHMSFLMVKEHDQIWSTLLRRILTTERSWKVVMLRIFGSMETLKNVSFQTDTVPTSNCHQWQNGCEKCISLGWNSCTSACPHRHGAADPSSVQGLLLPLA